jgi:hypothetical protein
MAGKPRKPAASKATVRRRVEEVLRIRLDGAEFWDTCEFVREQEAKEGSAWHLAEGDKPLSDSQIRRYIARADNIIAESGRASRKRLLRRHLAQRRNLYAKAVLQGDVKAALAVLRDEAALLDLYPSAEAKLAAEVEALKKMLAEAEARNRESLTHGDGHPESTDPGPGGAGSCDPQPAPPAGADPPRPDADDDGGGDDAGPMANRPSPLFG